MRLGIMTGLGMKTPEGWATAHVAVGSQAVAFPLNCEAKRDDILAYRDAADKNGLIISEVGVWKNTLSSDKAERKAMIEYAIEQLKLAELVGARCCVNVAGTPHGPRWDGGYAKNFSKETRKEIVEMVRTIIDEVNPVNTKYTLEPMPWMVPTGPEDYLQLIEEVDREAFGVHLDLINMVTTPERYFFLDEFMDKTFELLGDKICSVHLKDIRLQEEFTFRLEECACGKGILNVKRYLDKCTAVREDVPVLIEHLRSDAEYICSLKYVQGLLK